MSQHLSSLFFFLIIVMRDQDSQYILHTYVVYVVHKCTIMIFSLAFKREKLPFKIIYDSSLPIVFFISSLFVSFRYVLSFILFCQLSTHLVNFITFNIFNGPHFNVLLFLPQFDRFDLFSQIWSSFVSGFITSFRHFLSHFATFS